MVTQSMTVLPSWRVWNYRQVASLEACLLMWAQVIDFKSLRGNCAILRGCVYHFVVLLSPLVKWGSHDSVEHKHEHANSSLVTPSTTPDFILNSWTHTNTFRWAMLRSFEPQLHPGTGPQVCVVTMTAQVLLCYVYYRMGMGWIRG